MIYFIKYNINDICKRLVQEQLTSLGLKFTLLTTNELDVPDIVSDVSLNKLNLTLNDAGIEIMVTQKIALVQKIKKAITDLVSMEDKLILSKTSYHLAKTLNYSYRYLAGIFSEITYTTIENYIILQKIEKAKDMIASGEFTFTDIAWKLNYSSVAHFSMQFKNTTGFTPSLFKRIINQKRNAVLTQANL